MLPRSVYVEGGGIQARNSCVLGKHSTEPHPQPQLAVLNKLGNGGGLIFLSVWETEAILCL